MRIAHRQSEALAWRAVAEVVRRHPEFEQIEFFWRIPGAGPPGYYAARFHVQGRTLEIGLFPGKEIASVSRDRIALGIGALANFPDIRSWASRVEEAFGLDSPSSTPATSQAAIGFRLVAEVLHRRLCERPFATAMPANLSNSSGTIYEHPNYQSMLASLWGDDSRYGYQTFLWHVVAARPTTTDPDHRFEWPQTLSGDQGHAGLDDELESAWDRELQQIAVATAPTWIAPQRGLAINKSGDTVDLLELYDDNNRSVSRASNALFG